MFSTLYTVSILAHSGYFWLNSANICRAQNFQAQMSFRIQHEDTRRDGKFMIHKHVSKEGKYG